MKNTLVDLNNYLFETLERLMDDDLTGEQLQKELTRSQAVTKASAIIVQNTALVFKAAAYANDYGHDQGCKLPLLLGEGDDR